MNNHIYLLDCSIESNLTCDGQKLNNKLMRSKSHLTCTICCTVQFISSPWYNSKYEAIKTHFNACSLAVSVNKSNE